MASVAAAATTTDVLLQQRPGLLGDSTRPGVQALPRLVADAEAALEAGHLQLAQTCLQTYFAETANRQHAAGSTTTANNIKAAAGPASGAAVVDQHMVRAHFAAGQLVSKLSSSCKGQQLVDAVLEAVAHIMRGVDLAAANPRYSHLVYNGSVHWWHAVRPLQCDKLRQHLLPSQEKLCQALEKVEGQPAWRVRHLLSLALCQSSVSEEGGSKAEAEVSKTLSKALDLATAAGLQRLRAEVLALQTHHQTLQAAKAAAAKPGGGTAGAAAAGGKAAAAAAAPPAPPAAAVAKQGAAAGKKKAGDAAAAAGAGKADVDGALAILQWVLSARPDAAVAEQQLQAALKLLDVSKGPDKSAHDALLKVVGRIGWAAAVCGVTQLAEQCTRRAAASQELGPRVWADLTRLLLSSKAAPDAALGAGSDSSGTGAVLSPAAVEARREVLEGVDEAVTAFLKLGDVEGIHNCAVLAWNTGLPLLQPRHRALLKPVFTAVAKALEAVGSPWSKLRAALHLEVAKAEADADSFIKAAKEVSTALSLNYPSSADMAAGCGYERALDRYLEPMARAAQLRGVAPVQASSSSSSRSTDSLAVASRTDDDVVLLLERAKDSKSALRSEYLQKAINKLSLLPAVPPPPGPATTDSLQQQLQAARARTQLWVDIVELAWRPCQLDTFVRSAVPFVLGAEWQPCRDKEMLLLQARVALVGVDAAKAALSKADGDVGLPVGYAPALHSYLQTSNNSTSSSTSGRAQAPAAGANSDSGKRPHSTAGTGHRRGDKSSQESLGVVEDLQRLVADYILQSMQLSVAAGGSSWLVMNAAKAAWNTYLPLMQREEHYADLAGLLLPLLQQLLQEPSTLEPNLLVMLAEATAKAAEHATLLTVLQYQQHQQQQHGLARQEDSYAIAQQQQSAAGSVVRSHMTLAEARAAAAGMDVGTLLLAAAPEALQLATDAAAAVQAVLTRAATASQPQGLIQAYARLQQLQNKPVTVPPGAPAAMADTSKLLALIEGLTASAPSSQAAGGAAAAVAQPAVSLHAPASAAGRLSSASSNPAAAASKVSSAGGKGAAAAAAPTMSKAEQDVRAAMALLSAMPTVNLQLWAQLSRAAGWHGLWLLARDCATAAVGALPAGKRDLAAVAAASDVPEVGAQGWYWLAVAEMQQGQAIVSLLPAATGTGPAGTLSLRHAALQHYATATRLASFVRRSDLADAAARLAHNAVVAPGGLLETDLTKAAAVPALTEVAAGLNSTRPSDISFQVKLNVLLLECLSAAGRWTEARRHVEALHRSLPLSKQKGPAAAAALEALAGWRATCVAKEASGRVQEDMTRLLAELSTPQAKARAWLALAQASSSPQDQLSGRQSALAALKGLPPGSKVEYQEFAEWLAASAGQPEAAAAAAAGLTPEQLLLGAVAALDRPWSGRPCSSASCGSNSSSSGRIGGRAVCTPGGGAGALPAAAPTAAAGAANTAAVLRRRSRCTAEDGAELTPGEVANRRLEQLIRVHLMLSQVTAATIDRREHLLLSQACAQQLLTSSLLAAGAEAPLILTGCDESAAAAVETVGESNASDSAADVQALQHRQQQVSAATNIKQQQQPLVVPALALPSRPATASTGSAGSTCRSGVSAGAASSAAPCSLCKSKQLPGSVLAWAVWLPDDTVVQQLQSAAAAAAAAASGGAKGSVANTATTAAAAVVADVAVASAGLSRVCMHTPELLLAHLRLLAEQLQASGYAAAALPVLQLARLVALVVLGSEVAAAAVGLQLSALCEQLGLSAAASEWLQLATPERWPTPEQLQCAEASMGVQQLTQDLLLQANSSSGVAAAASGGAATAGGNRSPAAAHQTAFLVEALQGVEPATLRAWQQACPQHDDNNTTNSHSSSSSTHSRPRSAAGVGAAAAAAAAASLASSRAGSNSNAYPQAVAGKLLQLKPRVDVECWVSIARYWVDHAQYTAGQKMCGLALQVARSAGDSCRQAEVLLLQAHLALLAQYYEHAVELSQAAQAVGGSVQLWRDSVLCYAAARAAMPGRGPADATEALEAGVALVETVARGCSPCFSPALLEASGRLKLQLSRHLAALSQQQLQEAEEGDPSCYETAAQLHSRALGVAQAAAEDAAHAGAVLLQAGALQQAAGLLLMKQLGGLGVDRQQQQQGQQRRRSPRHAGGVAAPRDQERWQRRCCVPGAAQQPAVGVTRARREAVQTALSLLQAAHDALVSVLDFGAEYPQAEPQVQQQQQQSSVVQQLPALLSTINTPTARALISVLVQLSSAETEMGQLQLQRGGQKEAEPQFPRVEGRDPRAVVAFLTAGDTQKDGETTAGYLASALQHAEAAAEAAGVLGLAALQSAALLAAGRACKLQAHAAMMDDTQQAATATQQQQPTDACVTAGSSISSSTAGSAVFEAAWLPWPGPLRYCNTAALGGTEASGGSVHDPPAASETSAAAQASGDSVDVQQQSLTANTDAGSARTAAAAAAAPAGAAPQQAVPQLPAAAVGSYNQAVQCFQQALHTALQLQELHTAAAAARELQHCYGQLQPDRAALYLAVAQSCTTAAAVTGWFEQAADLQHPEVLLWRQQRQLEEAGCGPNAAHQHQVQQLLGMLGTTHRRLQVPQPDTLLLPLLSQQPHQRLLLLHHDTRKQQLVLAAWGVPCRTQSAAAAAAAGAEGASQGAMSAATAAAVQRSPRAPSSGGGGGASTARAKRVLTARDSSRSSSSSSGAPPQDASGGGAATATASTASTAAAEGTASGSGGLLTVPPPPAVLASMPCTQQQLQELTAAFGSYARQLQKAVVQVTSQPVATPPPPADTTTATAAGGPAGATASKKPAAGAAGAKGGGAGGKDKAKADGAGGEVHPAWVPPAPVFPPELNEQWQQLLVQFERLLQPLADAMRDTLQPTTRAAEPTSTTSSPAKQGSNQKATSSTSGAKAASTGAGAAAAAAAAAAAQTVPVALQLLLDPQLCELPWEALPVVQRSCSSIARCLSLAQLQTLLVPPLPGSVQCQQAPADAAATSAATLDVSRLSYLVDPLHHMSAAVDKPGCYAAPLLPAFRSQLLDVWGGPEWQGFAGSDCQVPSDEQLLRPLSGAKGLLVLGPGRLLGHVGTQAVAGLDLSSCTAALLFDRLDNAAAANHQTRADNRKTAAQQALEGPCQTATLLMLRGVRAVAAAALPGTPHTHVNLAANVLRGMAGAALQPAVAAQLPPQQQQGGGASEVLCVPSAQLPAAGWTLGEAVLAAQRHGLAAFELQAMRDAGLVLYGVAGVSASGDGGGKSGKGVRAAK